MHLKFTNVNDAFVGLVKGFQSGTLFQQSVTHSRNGEVIMANEPMTITYDKPWQRVLFNRARDASPFFHLYEALWMLAGRNDIAPLAYYVSTMQSFSDDGVTQNGAYGYRWRHSNPKYVRYDSGIGGYEAVETTDQLDIIIEHLRNKPESRRAVLDMWNVEDDLLKLYTSKDVCCNLNVMFYLEDAGESNATKYLNMTVTNRSNDTILGMLGANVVHFSFLQEYVACALGAEMGVYNQFTNNMHVYSWNWKPTEWLKEPLNDYYANWQRTIPLFRLEETSRERFDEACKQFVELNKDNSDEATERAVYSVPFLDKVAQPLLNAFHAHKEKDYEAAKNWMYRVEAPDWKYAGINWIEKRRRTWMDKNKSKEAEVE